MIRVVRWRDYLAEPHMKEMLLGSLAGLVVKVLAALSLFALNVVVTRSLGAHEAGLFFLGFTLVMIIATIGRLGLDQAVVRFIARDRESKTGNQVHSIYVKATAWAFGLTLLLTLAFLLSAEALNDTLFKLSGFTPVFETMLLATPFIALYIVHAHVLQGLKQISKSMLVASVFLPIVILIQFSVTPVVYAKYMAGYFVIASIVTLLLGKYFWASSAPVVETSSPFSSSILRATCMPLWIVAVVHQVIQWSSQIMLGMWGDAQLVAFFATAQRTAMLTSFILFAVNAIAAPKFAAMHASGDAAGVKRLALVSVKGMMILTVPVTIFILLFPSWLMSLFGEEFRNAATALMILVVGQFINIATGSVGHLLAMTGHETKVRDNMIASGMVAVGLGVVLIPEYNLIGASVAYACGVASQNLLGVYQVKKYLGFNILCFWKA